MSKKFRFIVDPGHAWLEVPMRVLDELGVSDKISRYSYQSHDGRLAYLEEDCDAGVFVEAWAERRPPCDDSWLEFKPHVEFDYHDHRGAPPCFVRALPSYGDPRSTARRISHGKNHLA